jgi:hypothetical protein
MGPVQYMSVVPSASLNLSNSLLCRHIRVCSWLRLIRTRIYHSIPMRLFNNIVASDEMRTLRTCLQLQSALGLIWAKNARIRAFLLRMFFSLQSLFCTDKTTEANPVLERQRARRKSSSTLLLLPLMFTTHRPLHIHGQTLSRPPIYFPPPCRRLVYPVADPFARAMFFHHL